MIKLDNPGDWTIRVSTDSVIDIIAAFGVLHYTDNEPDVKCLDHPDPGHLPSICGPSRFLTPPSDQGVFDFAGILNDANTTRVLDVFTDLVPFPRQPAPATADHLIVLNIANPDPRLWTLDGIPWLPWREQARPTIFDPKSQIDADVAVAIPINSTVDIAFAMPVGQPSHVSETLSNSFLCANSSVAARQAFHKHSSKAWVVSHESTSLRLLAHLTDLAVLSLLIDRPRFRQLDVQ